jgi:hypothetical protein
LIGEATRLPATAVQVLPKSTVRYRNGRKSSLRKPFFAPAVIGDSEIEVMVQ